MAGFDDSVGLMEEWEKSSKKRVLERELSLNHGQVITFEDEEVDTTLNNNNDSSPSQTKAGLGQRIAARAGFNTPRLDTSLRSSCLTISSPGISPTTLLESPVFLSNPLAQPSPTTGKYPFLPGVNSLSYDKPKDDFFNDIGSSSFTFRPVSKPSSCFFQVADNGSSYNNMFSHQPAEENVKSGSQNIERSNLYGLETSPSGQKRRYDAITTTGLETIEHQEEEERDQRRCDTIVGGGAPAEDGYNWRKYGQKVVKGSEYPRSYYKCTNPSCQVKKKVERSKEGHITEIVYKGAHNHSKPLLNRRSGGMQLDGTEQVEPQQGGSNENNTEEGFEYGNQTQNVSDDAVVVVDVSSTFSTDEDDRETHGSVSLGYDGGEGDESESKRRKLEAYAIEMSGATRAIREPRVVVQTTSDVDILDDGYRWRKYGQKVVKGNPNPRSYYKCTAQGCTVRKHVERASHDLGSVITTYEGKHNHDVPAARNSSHGGGNNGNNEQSRGRYERQAMTTTTKAATTTFGRPFTYQPQFGFGQTGMANMSMPGLAFGQGKLPVMPNPYLNQRNEAMMMMQRGMEAKGEPVSETAQSVYNQIMSRLPQI